MDQQKLFDLILEKHKDILKNVNIKNNSKIIISFSGVPASGKTYISKIIEKKYLGVRVNSDSIRKIISKFPKEYLSDINPNLKETFKAKDNDKLKNEYSYNDLMLKQESLTSNYIKFFFEKYSFENKLLILDGSIDRKYEKIKKLSDKTGFKLIIIKLPLDGELIRERISKRDGKNATFFYDNMKRWIEDYNNFNNKNKADIIFENNKKQLLEELNKIILDN